MLKGTESVTSSTAAVVVGTLTAVIVGYLVIRFLLAYLRKGTLYVRDLLRGGGADRDWGGDSVREVWTTKRRFGPRKAKVNEGHEARRARRMLRDKAGNSWVAGWAGWARSWC